MHERYVGELLKGDFRDDTRQDVISLVARLRDEEQIDGVILGGTELPLLLQRLVDCGSSGARYHGAARSGDRQEAASLIAQPFGARTMADSRKRSSARSSMLRSAILRRRSPVAVASGVTERTLDS